MKYKTWTEVDSQNNPIFVLKMKCPICKEFDFVKNKIEFGFMGLNSYTCETCGNIQLFDDSCKFIEPFDN